MVTSLKLIKLSAFIKWYHTVVYQPYNTFGLQNKGRSNIYYLVWDQKTLNISLWTVEIHIKFNGKDMSNISHNRFVFSFK